ncbi:MAG: MMPL family transporter [Myxococcota bacterium]|nr:MMPL family transporter [Myxococcota bacterium]
MSDINSTPPPSSQLSTQDRIDAFLAAKSEAWVSLVMRHARLFAGLIGVLTIVFFGYMVENLRINSDNVSLISEDLPARQNHEKFAKLFPNLDNAIFVVIDAETPELSRTAAVKLGHQMRRRPEAFHDVYTPGGGSFFEKNGLLYQTPDQLDEFADEMAQVQPLIAALEADGSLANVTSLITQGLEAAQKEGIGVDTWPSVLERFGEATLAVFTEFPVAISWEELLLEGSAIESVTRRVLIVHPVLDFMNVFSASKPMAEIRELAEELGFTPETGVTIRITGNPALNYEEMFGIVWEVGVGGVVCFFVVCIILYFAFHSVKLMVVCVIALLTGLIWTGAFAAAAIGHLNIVSMAFAVLFIGLGVDFGIHLGMRYGELMQEGCSHEEAMRGSADSVGSSLLICAVTTAIGFFVFVPTQYLGVAELGLIAGAGMFIILFQTLTLFPALLSTGLAIKPGSIQNVWYVFKHHWWRPLERVPGRVVGAGFALGLLSLLAFPFLRFDPNVINMRNPSTQSVQAFDDLLAQAGTASPWFVNSVAPNIEAAQERAKQFAALDEVNQTITLADYIPKDQEEKLEILADINFLLETPGAEDTALPDVTIDEQVEAVRRLHEFLMTAHDAPDSPLSMSMRSLDAELELFLSRVEQDESPHDALESLEEILLGNLSEQLDRLHASLNTQGVTRRDLPRGLVKRMLTEDGQARIQVFPTETMQTEESFTRFVEAIHSVDPNAAGVAINLVGFAGAIRDSFRQALISAIVVIWVLLWTLWRRPAPVLLATAPLLLSSLMICAMMAILDLPFQFANVVVIPLLLGIGVDSGIHLVHRAENLKSAADELMGTTTARAVFFSALTTTISFGTLSFSGHRGLSSLGVLLSGGMILTVFTNLVILPALLKLRSLRNG